MGGGRALGHQLQVGGPGRQSVETCGGFLQSCLGCSIPGHQQKVGQPQLHRLRVGTEPQQPSSARRDAISIPLQSPPASTLCYKGPGATICGRLEELISLSFCSNNGNKKRTRQKTKINRFATSNQLTVLHHQLKLCNSVGIISANTRD